MQDIVDDIAELGGSIVALTPQTVERSGLQMEKNPLEYDVLTDPGNQYASQLGIRYQLPDYLIELYAQFGLDLPTFHAEPSWTLPIPARFIVDQQGIVRFSEASPDYTVRPEPQQTLDVLRQVVS